MNLPSLQGNWIDLLIVLFVLFYIWDGWGKGFIQLASDWMVFLASFVIALKLYPVVSQLLSANFSFPQGLAKAIGFFVLAVVIEQILSQIVATILVKIPEKIQRHRLNKILSVVPLMGNAILILAFVLTLILSLPIQTKIKSAISESKLGNPLVAKAQIVEKTVSGIFGDALTDTLNFITVPSSPTISKDGVKLNFTQHVLATDESAERVMFVKVNEERRLQGLPSLEVSANLRDLAREYGRDMFERGYFSHYNPEGESPFDRMNEVEITFQTAGENLALAPNTGIAHQGLMDSPGHRENILNPDFGKIGIGVIDGGVYGKIFVQEFTD